MGIDRMNNCFFELFRKSWHCFIRALSFGIRAIFPIKKGLVLCESFGGLQYACNPKYISEYILSFFPNDFCIVWLFIDPDRIKGIDNRITKAKRLSIKGLFYINTAEFIVSNIRWNDLGWGWNKRKGQKYIMTWHGSMALKRVEFDVGDSLPNSYLTRAEMDSKRIDLIPSDSVWCTGFLRKAFHYNGSVLEGGVPRNDLFLQPERIKEIRSNVRSVFQIAEDKSILLYAPTFRADKRLDPYITQWDNILHALEHRFGQGFVVMIRLHPNMMKVVDTSPLLNGDYILDATQYNDMQELLCAADVLITDYSSSMFEMGLMRKPCFLYVPDEDTYDRGFYFSLKELPFPSAKDMGGLRDRIEFFNENHYVNGLQHLYRDVFQSNQIADSCRVLIDWMLEKSIS